uniref:LamG-like jellyroll fold domain-containing protein n=1 Tax=viral metagenome TaxID=1070528 RepID=A0A6C0ET39_9ZZZZ
MNTTAIILGIVIIILIYVLYRYFTNTTTTLGSLTDLSSRSTTTPFTIKGDIASSTSPRYSFGLWLYIDTWDSNQTKNIFYRQNSDTSKYDIRLYLEPYSPILKCDFYTKGSSSTQTETITITNNFSVQKWVYIIISADNKIIDCYIDGKLVTSQQLQNQPTFSDTDIYVGSFNAHLAKFQRITSPMDPQTAWSNYMSGNGGNTLSKMFSSYGLDVTFKKDNVQQQTFSIF